MRAFGENALTDPPPGFAELEKLPVMQKKICDVNEIDDAVRALF